MSCRIVVIEGPDRVGKKTQSTMLAERLRSKGKPTTTVVEVPCHDFLTYGIIYRMLRNGMASTHPNLFQFVQFLNKFLFQIFKLPFLKLKYDYVILDRWSLSSIVYGEASGANKNLCRRLYKMLEKPNITLVLSGPSRIQVAEDVYEANSDFQQKVAELYSTYHDGTNFIKINASGTIKSTHEEIWMTLAWLDVFNKL